MITDIVIFLVNGGWGELSVSECSVDCGGGWKRTTKYCQDAILKRDSQKSLCQCNSTNLYEVQCNGIYAVIVEPCNETPCKSKLLYYHIRVWFPPASAVFNENVLIVTQCWYFSDKTVSFTDDGICFYVKISTYRHGSYSEWQLGECNGNETKYDNFKTYFEKCCLKFAQHTLTCINKKYPSGWDFGYIEIQGHRYCDDFMSYRMMQRITIRSID